jgi:hypothetical protein
MAERVVRRISLRTGQFLPTVPVGPRRHPFVAFPYPGLGKEYFADAKLLLNNFKYNAFTLFFSWFALANLWLTFRSATGNLREA